MKRRDDFQNFHRPDAHASDTTDLLHRIQQQLNFLEKKLDALLARGNAQAGETRPFQHSEQRHERHETRFDHNRNDRPLHRAVCADCDRACEVPFRPSHGRPVYCKDCFSKRKSDSHFDSNANSKPEINQNFDKHPFKKFIVKDKFKPSKKSKPEYKKKKR